MTEDYWSRFPDTYDENQRYVVGNELLDQITKMLDGLPEAGKAVELGCGTGYFTEAFSRHCTSIIATDLSDSLLGTARMRFHGRPEISIQKEDCMETSFPSGAFDSVFMANLVHVVESPNKVLRECHRILRDGGTVVIVTFTGHGMKLWEKIKMGARFSKGWGRPPSHTHSFSPEQLASIMEDSGFNIETSKLIGQRTKALFAVGRKNGGLERGTGPSPVA